MHGVVGRSPVLRALRPALRRGGAARPLCTLPHKPDVVLVGAGVIGASLALQLARKGFRTVNLDKAAAPGYGSTSFSSGICRSYYSALDSVKLSWEGYQYWSNWQDYVQLPSSHELPTFRKIGGLLLKSEAATPFLTKVQAHFDTLAIPYHHMSKEHVRDKYGFSVESYGPPRRIDDERFGEPSGGPDIDGAVWVPDTGYISDPQLGAATLMAAAQATGNSHALYNAQVTQIMQQGGRVRGVRLADGREIECGVVVNVAGPHSSAITKLAFPEGGVPNDMRLTTRAWRTEAAHVPLPATAPFLPDMCPVINDFDVGLYMRHEVGNRLLIGSTEPDCDPVEFVDEPDRLDLSHTDQWNNLVYRAALRIPYLQVPNMAQGVVAMYDVTEDWMPIYDKSSLPGYYMAIGTSGNQFKNAGSAAAMMAQIIEDCENGVDHDATPVQFRLHHTANVINSGVFSRRRVVQETSRSVLA